MGPYLSPKPVLIACASGHPEWGRRWRLAKNASTKVHAMRNEIDVIGARLDALDRELDVVLEVIGSLADERAEAVALHALAERVAELTNSAIRSIADVRAQLETTGPTSEARYIVPLTTIQRDLHRLEEAAYEARQAGSQRVRPGRSHGDWLQTARAFKDQAGLHAHRLDVFRNSIGGGRGKSVGVDRWRTLSTILQEHVHLLDDAFSLIAGVTTGQLEVNAGVLALANDLLSDLESITHQGQASIAILAQGEVFLERANAIALRLSDTTVWNVPIAAHEFGHLVAQSPTLRTFISEDASPLGESGALTERHRNELFADVFASHALGPAYVLPSIMLRMDPARAYEPSQGHPSPAFRAHVMTRALANGTYSRGVLTRRTLRATAKVWPYKPDADEMTTLNNFVDRVLTLLDRELLRHASLQSEAAIVEMLERSIAGDSLDLDPDLTVADLLNAAWDCRTRGPAERSRVDALSAAVLAIAGRLRSSRMRRYQSAPMISPR
jgi:hypothetical protein